MAGVVQHDEIDVPVHGDMDPRHVAEFGMVGDRAHGPVLRLQDVDLDLGMVGQQRAAPPAGPEGRDRRQGEGALSGRIGPFTERL